ncbi:MAG: dTMP kinase [Gammaproteobacteria bacterium]|nr:dTMP kinase [Gammaproteobacteria bacterium]
MQARFITVEGIEGVGKSTQMAFIQQWLKKKGVEVETTREPGGTPLAEQIRDLLLKPRSENMPEVAELLLMFAARAVHIQNRISPALAQSRWVLCDRFTDATFAYQGAGRGMGVANIQQLEQQVQGDLRPDLTLLLDAPVATGLARAGKRGPADRFEQETVQFFERVRQGYLARAKAEPTRIKVVSAEGGISQVQDQIGRVLEQAWIAWNQGEGR